MSRFDEDDQASNDEEHTLSRKKTTKNYTLTQSELKNFPTEMHTTLQKEADALRKSEARLAPGESRSHRDFLKRLRVFLLKLDPNISILKASNHPLACGKLSLFDKSCIHTNIFF